MTLERDGTPAEADAGAAATGLAAGGPGATLESPATGERAGSAAPGARRRLPARRPSGGSNSAALGRLLPALAAIVALAALLDGWAVLVVVLALVVMVMVHELGHFATAKWSGMKVTEYFLGFGPRLWSVRRGETEYGVKAIPAGGYVRIVGMTSAEQVDTDDEPRSYRQASFPRRIAVAVAGSFMHFVMAFLLLFAIFAIVGVDVPSQQVTGLVSLSGRANPARQAGVRPGDVIVAVDGHAVGSAGALVAAISGEAGKSVTLTVRRDGRTVTLHATPLDGRHVAIAGTTAPLKSGPRPVGFLGVDLGFVRQTTNPLVAVQRGGSLLGSVTATTARGIAAVFSLHGLSSFFHSVATAGRQHPAASSATSGTGGASASGASGSSGSVLSIVGAVEIGAQLLHQDVGQLLGLLAEINIFVGLVNLFPMLPLDGGHVLIAVYERVRSRRGRRYHADVSKLMPVAYLFLAFIVVVGLSALYANIVAPPSIGG